MRSKDLEKERKRLEDQELQQLKEIINKFDIERQLSKVEREHNNKKIFKR